MGENYIQLLYVSVITYQWQNSGTSSASSVANILSISTPYFLCMGVVVYPRYLCGPPEKKLPNTSPSFPENTHNPLSPQSNFPLRPSFSELKSSSWILQDLYCCLTVSHCSVIAYYFVHHALWLRTLRSGPCHEIQVILMVTFCSPITTFHK